ncbi:stage VI sporulation protein F [Paenibacillus koleovorans]|uniref:stage VI sporulation protein F n=1 Tax=Paenibacillus koleovorans TaxID=121608 RepID=UPI000FDCA8A3|nr:stage VI sporulation protein F [Paenibacillus koleovorans]
MSYQKYGIERELVERIKTKLKNPQVKERVKSILDGVTKQELQDRTRVKLLTGQLAKAVNEPLTVKQTDQIVHFVVDMKIDPNNTFHLIKLWGMFR